MAAIAGFFDPNRSSFDKQAFLCDMLAVMSHRGTLSGLMDGCAFEGSIAPERGKHPSGIRVAMDGEIYTPPAQVPCPYGISDDALAVIEAYHAYGEDFAARLDGTFSLALWDFENRKLFLVRDRLGTKPLFYFQKPGMLLFASELKGILASGLCDKTVNWRTLDAFLSFGYPPNPLTMFEGIMQVRPASMIIFKDGRIIERVYWKYQQNPDAINPNSESEQIAEFFEVLKSSVRKRLRKHPDAGAFLSGGLDTSAVVAILKQLRNEPIKVFTAGFYEKSFDETEDAKAVADHLDLDHHTIFVDFGIDFPQLLDKLVWHHDGPFADTSAVPSYFVAKLASEHVDTVFTGDFPDQLIGGSGHQVLALKRHFGDPSLKRFFRSLHLAPALASLHWRAQDGTFVSKLKRYLFREAFSLEDQRIILGMPVPPLLKTWLYDQDLLELSRANDIVAFASQIYRDSGSSDLLSRLLYFDVCSYAADDLMVKVDRMSAAHTLNTISPFHDVDLVTFVSTLGNSLKIRGQIRKYILREAIRSYLPDRILKKRKQGFAMPIGAWLTHHYSDYVREILFDSRSLARGYFRQHHLRTMVNSFLEGRTDYATGSEATIISLITLELWHRRFIDA